MTNTTCKRRRDISDDITTKQSIVFCSICKRNYSDVGSFNDHIIDCKRENGGSDITIRGGKQ